MRVAGDVARLVAANRPKKQIEAALPVLFRILPLLNDSRALLGSRGRLSLLEAYALAASWLPSGRKYCVPLMGAETLRNSSCKSSLRSTKSISEVFTISRSDEV